MGLMQEDQYENSDSRVTGDVYECRVSWRGTGTLPVPRVLIQ